MLLCEELQVLMVLLIIWNLLKIQTKHNIAGGTDNQSVWNYEIIVLTYQRLSIIDLNDDTNQSFNKDDLVIEDITGYRFKENDFGSLVSAMERRINNNYSGKQKENSK